MLIEQIICVVTKLTEQSAGLVEKLSIFEEPLYNAILLSTVTFFTLYFTLNQSSSRSHVLNGIFEHIMYVLDPIIDFAKSVSMSTLNLLNELKNVLTYHLVEIVSNRITTGRFFSPKPQPTPTKIAPVLSPIVPVQKLTEEKIVELINVVPSQSSSTNQTGTSSPTIAPTLESWTYGNKSHTRKQPSLFKNVSSKNRHVIAYGGDTGRDLNNACNVDLKHVLSYAALNYGVPLSNCHLVSQINRNTDTMVEFVNDFTKLVNETKNTNEKLSSLKETSHTNVWSVLNKVLRSVSPNEPSFVLLHYSGHGANQKDDANDEKDGMDEYILSGRNTIITDDELYEGFISKLPSTCTLLLQMDQCFSGTSTDLPYKYNSKTNTWTQDNSKFPKCKAYSLSACNDSQYAYQAFYAKDGGKNEEGGPLSMTMVEQELNGNPLYCEIDDMTNLYKVFEKSIFDRFKQTSYLLASESAKKE